MEIEEGYVKVFSKEEFRNVEDVCFKNGIEWEFGGKKHLEHNFKEPSTLLHINEHDDGTKFLTYNASVDDYNYISYETFMSRYDKDYECSKYSSTKTKKYRIRTEEEFINRFGTQWRDNVKHQFTTFMDTLLGEPLTDSEVNRIFDINCSGIWKSNNSGTYHISKDMIIEDSYSVITTLKNKVSSLITTKPLCRIKTEEEAIKEFGDEWRSKGGIGFYHGMDYLLGKVLTPEETKEYLTKDKVSDIDGYVIGGCMITKGSLPIRTIKRRLVSLLSHNKKPVFKLNDSLYKKNRPNLTQSNTVRQL